MLRPDDLINFTKSFQKLLLTGDWEALVTVIIIAGAIGFGLAWVYYRVLRRPRPNTATNVVPSLSPDPLIGQQRQMIGELETKVKGLGQKISDLEAERDRLKGEMRADKDVLDRMLTNEGEIWRTCLSP